MKQGTGRGRYHYLFLAAFISLLLVFPVFSVYADEAELAKIQSAIVEKGAPWEAKENPISQLPPEEIAKRLGALVPTDLSKMPPPPSAPALPPGGIAIPASFSWRNNGGNFVTPIRDQGSCGSCWAFATTAALESKALINFYKPGTDINFSEQIVVSCSGAGNCLAGGYASTAANFLRDYGTVREGCYPYTATDGNCLNACSEYNSGYLNTSNYRISNWSYVFGTNTITDPVNAVIYIKSAIYSNGPVVTWFKVYGDFLYYSSGVYSHVSGTYKGNHFVIIVGWDDTNNCFIAKNSWGTDWGESGYFRINYNQVGIYTDYDDGHVQFGNWTQYFGNINYPVSPTVNITLLTVPPDYPTNTNVTLNVSTTGVPRQIRTSLGTAWSAWQTLPPTNTINVSLGTANGQRDVFVQVKDFVGRISPADRTSVFLDNTAPTGNVKINGGAATVRYGGVGGTPVHLNLAMFDRSMSSSPLMRIKKGSPFTGDPDPGATGWIPFAAGYDGITFTGTGLRTVYVQFKDDYGNKSAACSASITVSGTGAIWPGVLGVTATNLKINGGVNLISNPSVTLTYDVSGTTNIKARYLYPSSAGTTYWTLWETVGSTSMTKNLTFASGSGARRVYVQLKDTSTGGATDPVSVWVVQDTLLPSGLVRINNGDASVKSVGPTSPVTLNITARDHVTYVASMAYNQTGATPLAGDYVGYTETVNAYPLNTATPGTKNVYIWFKDQVGNLSPPYSTSIVVK